MLYRFQLIIKSFSTTLLLASHVVDYYSETCHCGANILGNVHFRDKMEMQRISLSNALLSARHTNQI